VYYQGLLVKQSFATNVQDVYILYSLSQHVSAYLMAILGESYKILKEVAISTTDPLCLVQLCVKAAGS
jgi:hypothetical protein